MLTVDPAPGRCTPENSGSRQAIPARAALAVLGMALATRLAYLARVADEPLRSDAAQYHELAANLARGRGFVHAFPQLDVHATAFRPPLYPFVLSLWYRITGVSPGAGRVLGLVVGLAVVAMAMVLARRIAGDRAALWAGGLVAIFPPLVANDTTTLADSLSLLLLLVVTWALLERRPTLAGLAAGSLALTKPSMQLLVLALAVWVVWRIGWRPALRFGLIAAVVVAPWLVRNEVELGSPVLVTSNGFNMAAIYSAEAEATGHFVDAVHDPRFERFRLAQFDEVAWDRALREDAFANVRANPAQVIDVVAGNVLHWFELRPSDNEGAESLDGRDLTVRRATMPLVWIVTTLGIVGLVRLRQREDASLLLLLWGYTFVTTVVFMVPPRLRGPADLVTCIGLGLLVAQAVPAISRRHLPRPAVPTWHLPKPRPAFLVTAMLLLVAALGLPRPAGEAAQLTTEGASGYPVTVPAPASRHAPAPGSTVAPTPAEPLDITVDIVNPTRNPFVVGYARLDDDLRVVPLNNIFSFRPVYEATWRVLPPGAEPEGPEVLNGLVLPDDSGHHEMVVGVAFNDGVSYANSDVWELRYEVEILATTKGARVVASSAPTAWHLVDDDGTHAWTPAEVGVLTPAADPAEATDATAEPPRGGSAVVTLPRS